MSLDFKMKRWLRGLGAPPALWNPLWMSPLEPQEIAALFGGPAEPEELYSEAIAIWEGCASPDDIDRTLEFFTILYLQDDVLVKVDRASMMASLEVRAPFLDKAVVEFARRLPNRFKFRGGERKYILKRALSGVLPDAILRRRKKGFGIPLAKWLRELPPPAPPHVGFLDSAWLARRWERHRLGREDGRLGLWCWLALERHFAAMPAAVGREVTGALA
jgi:asparagine synthase (glutamine-hydrolysing)